MAIGTNNPLALAPGSSLLPFFVRRSYRFCCLSSSAGRTGSAAFLPPVVPVPSCCRSSSAGRTGSAAFLPPVVPVLLPFFRRSYRFCCLSSAGRTGSSLLPFFVRRTYRFLIAAFLPPVVPVLSCCLCKLVLGVKRKAVKLCLEGDRKLGVWDREKGLPEPAVA